MSEFSSLTKDFFGSLIGKLITIIIVLSLLTGIITMIAGIGPFGRIAQRTMSGDAIVNNYEEFHRLYDTIQAQIRNVNIMRQMDTDQITLTGTIMQVNNLIADYNAKSRMITRNMWKSNTLPYQLSWDGIEDLREIHD